MDQLIEFALFGGKVLIIVIGIIIVMAVFAILALKNKAQEQLDIEILNDKFKTYASSLKSIIFDKKELKTDRKKEKKQDKEKEKDKEKDKPQKHVFVMEFDGDIKASGVNNLRNEITAILSVASKEDEVVVCVESAGGMVHSYGLAAAQLLRIKDKNIKLTICVDKMAASGGYMMACTGDKILAAPFAIIGSIGVLAQVPNFNKVLKKHDIDYQEITAGEYKRTLSIFGEITEKGKEKFTEQIEDTHVLFKDFVHSQRPHVDISKVATGEHWFGKRAKDLKLIDELMTSDEYLFGLKDDAKILKIKMQTKKKLGEKISDLFGQATQKMIKQGFETLNLQRYL